MQHGVLFEKGLDGVVMTIGMEEQAAEVLLLITPVLTVDLHANLAFRLLRFISGYEPAVAQ